MKLRGSGRLAMMAASLCGYVNGHPFRNSALAPEISGADQSYRRIRNSRRRTFSCKPFLKIVPPACLGDIPARTTVGARKFLPEGHFTPKLPNFQASARIDHRS